MLKNDEFAIKLKNMEQEGEQNKLRIEILKKENDLKDQKLE